MPNQLQFFFVSFLASLMCLAQSSSPALSICWDTSYSMKQRQLDKELIFLDSLITAMKVEQIQLLSFSNDLEEKNFTINDGDWSALREILSQNTYDGTTKYQRLNQVSKKGKSVVFTDGNIVLENDFLSLDEGDILVNSSPNSNLKTLQLWEFLNRAKLFDYADGIDKSKSVEQVRSIEGAVYLDGKPLANAFIRSSSGKSFITDAEGQFQYRGSIGDTLSIKDGKNKTQELVVDNQESVLRFFLDSKTVELDEVIVSEERLEEIKMVDVGYISMEQKKIGFAVYDIPEERISEVEGTVTEVLQEVPGLLMSSNNPWDSRNTGLSTARVRGKSSISFDPKVLVVVDGTPQQRSRNHVGELNATYFHINPQNIKSMKVLKGLSATNLYGSEGSGGVILITTKTASVAGGGSNGKPVDRARLTNNIFEGKLISKKGQLNAPYLKELKKSKNLKGAYQKYLGQREVFFNNYWYFIDISDYFRTANKQLANKVLSNVLELPFTYKAKRTLFLKHVELGQNGRALDVAESMLKNHPNTIQTYLDVATAHQNMGNYQTAAELLNGVVMERLDTDLDFGPVNKVASAELRNLVNLHRGKLDLSKIDANYKNNIAYNARLRFDWASPQNEFTLKFVNPQNRFFDWEHSNISDKNRIVDEIKNGFLTEQFELVGDSAKGKWGIYITNLSTTAATEPYWIKCRVDYNFGKSNQRSEEKIIRLDPKEDKEQLFFEFTVH
ncbi:MAG: TonB-dependent receptor plug domain-containing protein [Bacteroidota bacterium]